MTAGERPGTAEAEEEGARCAAPGRLHAEAAAHARDLMGKTFASAAEVESLMRGMVRAGQQAGGQQPAGLLAEEGSGHQAEKRLLPEEALQLVGWTSEEAAARLRAYIRYLGTSRCTIQTEERENKGLAAAVLQAVAGK